MRLSLCVVVLCLAPLATCDIGNGVWRTFSPNALLGRATPLPGTLAEATAAGWSAMSSSCDPNLGIQYAQTSSGPSSYHPLSVFFTSGGQISGVGVNIYGSSSTSSVGNAAQPQLVSAGFWEQVGNKEWKMFVSFRPSSQMCSGLVYPDAVGDRVVINQHSIAVSVPLTAADARRQHYTPGSCMKTMGQHYFLDRQNRNGTMSWVEGNLQPLVPMYYPPNSDQGTISAIFFPVPVVQTGSYLLGKGDWESPFLTASLMCQNWCAEDCHWTTKAWSTMHIYLNKQWNGLTCPGGAGPVGRACY